MKRLSFLSPRKKPRGSGHLSALSATVSPPLSKNNDSSSEATDETSNSSVVASVVCLDDYHVSDHEETSPLATILIRNVDDSDAQASRDEEQFAQATPFNEVLSTMMSLLPGGSFYDCRRDGADNTYHGNGTLCDEQVASAHHDSEILVVQGKSIEDEAIVNDLQDVGGNDGADRSDGKPSIVELSLTSSTLSTLGSPEFERATCGELPPGLKKLQDFVSNEMGNCSANFTELARDAVTGMNDIQNGNCIMDMVNDDDDSLDRVKSIKTASGSVYSV